MRVSVGTFNLNNLFSRFNFQAEISEPPAVEGGLQLAFAHDAQMQVRLFQGRLVRGKAEAATRAVAERILAMNVDVLALQEVEHIEVLKQFNRDHLGSAYPHLALVEGNDRRLIDVALLSRYPLGSITSFQTATHPDNPALRVFSRDLVRVEILNPGRSRKLFSLYNTHLKSHFVPFGQDRRDAQQAANRRRQQQAEMIARLIGAAERPNSSYALVGDMNDPPDSPSLQPMLSVDGRALVNALRDPTETRPPKAERQGPGPATRAWTYRRNPPGPAPPEYTLLDQIWLSQALAPRLRAASIDRRTRHGGDGSDHDPAWVELQF